MPQQSLRSEGARKVLREFTSNQDLDTREIKYQAGIPKTADFGKALNPSPEDAAKYLDKVNLTSSVEVQQSSREISIDSSASKNPPQKEKTNHGLSRRISDLDEEPKIGLEV